MPFTIVLLRLRLLLPRHLLRRLPLVLLLELRSVPKNTIYIYLFALKFEVKFPQTFRNQINDVSYPASYLEANLA